MTAVPIIGGPKLTDAPSLPNKVLDAYLGPLTQGIAAGASFAQPVTIELLILATALRDLRDLRAAAGALSQAGPPLPSQESAWNTLMALLPAPALGGPRV